MITHYPKQQSELDIVAENDSMTHTRNLHNVLVESPATPDVTDLQIPTFDNNKTTEHEMSTINFDLDRFPYCIVWTPIPVLSWLLPMVGHMGICMSNGIIRDFAGPYYVSEDHMGFGRPTRYLQLNPNNVEGGRQAWDEAVSKASVIYGTRMHNLFWDNCHSHVGTALAHMRYKGRQSGWNMILLAFWMFFCGKYVGCSGFMKTWLPFLIFLSIVIVFSIFL